MTAQLGRRPERVSNPVFARAFPQLSQAMEADGMAAPANRC